MRNNYKNSFIKRSLKKIVKNKKFVVCFSILILCIISFKALCALCPYSYKSMNRDSLNLKPFEYSRQEIELKECGEYVFPHIFGTDNYGRDYFARVMFGLKISFIVGIVSSVMITMIGFIYGTIAGYFGGRLDKIMMGIANILYSIPDMLMIIILAVTVQQIFYRFFSIQILGIISINILIIIIIFSLLYWVNTAKIIRAEIMSLKQNDYIIIAKTMGLSTRRIIFRHIMPNCLNTLITCFIFQVPSCIFAESFLSFIGLGIQSSTPSLGMIINESRGALISYSYRLLIPCIIFIVLVSLLNGIGEGIRDSFDTKNERYI